MGLLWLVLTGTSTGFAQSNRLPVPEWGAVSFENFPPETNGGHSQNWSVTQDERGIIYAANGHGILIYDGLSWRKIELDPRVLVRTVLYGLDHTLYVGAHDEIGYLTPDSTGTLHYQSLLDQIPASLRDFNDVWTGAVTTEAVYFLTRNMLFRWDGHRMHHWTTDEETPFFRLFTVDDTVYVQQHGIGLKHIRGDTLAWAPGGERFADDQVYMALRYDDQRLLLGLNEDGLFLFDGTTLTPFEVEPTAFLQQNELNGGIRLPDGTVAFATLKGGVLHMDAEGHTLRIWDKATGLLDQDVKNLFVDRDGGLWLAMENGLARIEVLAPASIFDERVGLGSAVYSLERHQGTLYAGTSNGLFRLTRRTYPDGRAETVFDQVPGIGNIEVFAILSTPSALLAGTNKGLYILNNGQTQHRDVASNITVLHASRRYPGRIYVGYRNGLGTIDARQNQWTVGPTVNALSNKEIHHLYEDEAGTLWVGSFFDGLWRMPDTDTLAPETPVLYFSPEEGHPASVRQLFTHAGRMRVITDKGLYAPATYTDGTMTMVPDTTLVSDIVGPYTGLGAFYQSDDGTAWVFKDDPMTRARRTPDGAWRLTYPMERLPFWPTYATLLDEDGTFWMGGPKGLLRHAADGPVLPPPPPSAPLIRNVTLLDTGVSLFGGYTAPDSSDAPTTPHVPHTENALRFIYTAPTFNYQRAPTTYEVFLEGFDEEWSPPTDETQKDYTNLPPGSYRFRVRTHDVDGRRSPEARYAFTIVPPWYRTGPAYAGYFFLTLIVFLGLVHGIVQWRSSNLKNRTEQLERIVAQRTAEMQDQKVQLEKSLQSLREQEKTLQILNKELQIANAALWKANEDKTHLLGMASHDLRAPLTSINGLSTLLLEDFELEKRPREFVTLIQSASQKVIDMIAGLLNTVAIESGRIKLNKQPLDLAETAEWVVHGLQAQAAMKDQTLRYTAPLEGECLVEADAERLHESMENLISNAIKYSPRGKPIDVEVYMRDGACFFAVRDEGPGLSLKDQKKLFEPFQRLTPQPTDGEPSTGLGLFIVKQLMELHGGRVFVESKEGKGSTFILSLPITTSVVTESSLSA